MRICVFGLWHLGSVTAACLASKGHEVIGLDSDKTTIDGLSRGQPPIMEPGLAELTTSALAEQTLKFTTSPEQALKNCDVLWVTFDTPVDENDKADVESVVHAVEELFPYLPSKCTVLISSQLPVGSTARLKSLVAAKCPEKSIDLAYSPENLRLGKAIDVFLNPDRVIVGVDSENARGAISEVFAPITQKIEWMSVASAEMVKHALNAFLATSVTFINEIATLCEYTGADAKEVERGLKSEARIGPKAYLSPGGAFAGGTLARDIMFLGDVAAQHDFPAHLLKSVRESNLLHKEWAYRRLKETLGTLKGRTVALWGLTYKPGTDTLRRSSAVELCKRLSANGVTVRAFDPSVESLPDDLKAVITLTSSAEDAARGSDALVITTEWPEFRNIEANAIAPLMKSALIIDTNRFLAQQWMSVPNARYLSVGKPA